MATKLLIPMLVVLLQARPVHVHPVIVCNCNTNVTVYTAAGSAVGVSTSSAPQNSSPNPHNLWYADSNTELKGDHRVLKRDNADVCIDPDCVTAAASILHSMDTSVDPCDDFFEYACGAWNRLNVIPDDKSVYTTFTQVGEKLAVVIKDLLEHSTTDAGLAAVKKTKNFYQSCLNEDAITKIGLAAVYDLIDELGGWPVLNRASWNERDFDLLALLAKLRFYNNGILVGLYVIPDDRRSDRHVIAFEQPHLGMPDREYYMTDTEKREVYRRYAVDVAMALGANRDVAERDMTAMLDFEISLANITVPSAERRDTSKLYKKMTLGALMANITEFDWLRYLQLVFKPVGIDITEDEEIVLYGVDFFYELASLLQSTDDRVLANYISWRVMMDTVKYLAKPYRDLKKEYNSVIEGIEMERARWRDCVSAVNDRVMGMVIGRLFVDNHFDVDSKHQALSIMKYIRESFHHLLDEAPWLDSTTRIVAREKAEAIGEMIGYPDIILNDTALDEEFSEIDFDPGRYLNNYLAHVQNGGRTHMRKLRLPVDKTEWFSSPVVVNAFYSTSKNQMYFPAGILQPPFYHKGSPRSMNFGGIGMVIGHEITHGFDDKGRLYDKDGNMQQWWNDDVIERFKTQASCIVEQYGNFTVESINMKINGMLTQGENIADNGGLKQAFWGYRKWIERENGGQEESRLPGLEHLSNDHLFFINFAQVWCGHRRAEAALSAVRSGPHSPGKFRVLGTLQNSREFAKTYTCPLNSPMNPEKKCHIW